MHFGLTVEQRDLRATVRRFLDEVAPIETVRPLVDGADAHRPAVWKRMAAELGLQSLNVPEEHDGAGAGFVELAVVLEEAGRVLLPEPLLATAVMAVGVLRHAGDEKAAARYLSAIASGETVATLAHTDGHDVPLGGAVRAPHPTRAVRNGDAWTVTGEKTLVLDGDRADLLLVTARTGRGTTLFAVRGDAPGLRRAALPVLDRTRGLAALRLDAVPAEQVGGEGEAGPAVERTLDEAAVAQAAEQVGGAQRCLDMAVAYAKTRVAFGRPIGSFQAVKHKCASLYLDIEAARASVRHAAWAISVGAADVPLFAAATAADSSEVFVRAAQENVQIHGGVGFTWEHDAHLFLRRARASRELLGSPAGRYERVARLLGV